MLLPLLIRFVPEPILPRIFLCLIGAAPICRAILVHFYGNALSAYALLPGRMDALFTGTLIAWIVRQPDLMAAIRRRVHLLWITAGIAATGFVAMGLSGGFDWKTPSMWTGGFSMVEVGYGCAMLAIIAGNWRPDPGFPLCAIGIGAYLDLPVPRCRS